MFLTLFSFTFLEHCWRPTADFLAKFDVCVWITQPCDRVVLAVEWYGWFNCGITGQFLPICGEGLYNKHMNVLTNERQCLPQYCEIVNPLSSVYPAPKGIIFDKPLCYRGDRYIISMIYVPKRPGKDIAGSCIAKFVISSPEGDCILLTIALRYRCFGCQSGRFFVVFRLQSVHLCDSSTHFIDFLLLVEDDLWSVWGCFFLGKPRLHNTFGVFW